MKPPRPTMGGREGDFWRWAYDELTALQPRAGAGVLVASTTRGVMRRMRDRVRPQEQGAYCTLLDTDFTVESIVFTCTGIDEFGNLTWAAEGGTEMSFPAGSTIIPGRKSQTFTKVQNIAPDHIFVEAHYLTDPGDVRVSMLGQQILYDDAVSEHPMDVDTDIREVITGDDTPGGEFGETVLLGGVGDAGSAKSRYAVSYPTLSEPGENPSSFVGNKVVICIHHGV